jgi:excisionase family DNA binding protein
MYKRHPPIYSDDTIQDKCVGCDVDKSKGIEDSLLTLKEVSRMLNMDVETLQNLADEGAIRCCRDSRGERRIRAEDVAIFLLEENIGFQMNLNLLLQAKRSRESTEQADGCAQSDVDNTGGLKKIPQNR